MGGHIYLLTYLLILKNMILTFGISNTYRCHVMSRLQLSVNLRFISLKAIKILQIWYRYKKQAIKQYCNYISEKSDHIAICCHTQCTARRTNSR